MAADDAAPFLFVLFGGAGDLARRKLLPAIHGLSRESFEFRILAVGLDRDCDDERYRGLVADALQDAGIDDQPWCEEHLFYQAVGSDDPDMRALGRRIEAVESDAGLAGDRVFYLAVPPAAFADIVEGLGRSGLNESPGFTRLVLEKPFGHDLDSARELNRIVHASFDESQVYRIDHFLGKDTVQNLLVLRFANVFLEAVWNRQYVDCVQISVPETLGVGGRVGYYDGIGALRDMVQNHLTQILSLVAMGVPVAYDAQAIRSEKVKLLRAVRPPRPDDVVFGRYRGYLDEEGVPQDSTTETYAALALEIDDWRWQGVPFYLRTGKRLIETSTEVALVFRRPPVCLFESLDLSHGMQPDVLRLRLQPDEGFSLWVDVKRPGTPSSLEKVPLDFAYASRFGELPHAYVTLLQDVLEGNQTPFVHADEVEHAWSVYEPLLESEHRVYEYAPGSWGPLEADALLARNGHVWRTG